MLRIGRRGGHRVAALVVVLACLAPDAPAQEAATPPDAEARAVEPTALEALRLTAGDHALASEVVSEGEVVRRHHQPGWGDYARALFTRLGTGLARRLLAGAEALGGRGFWSLAGKVLMAGALAALLAWLVHLALRWYRRAEGETTAQPTPLATLPAAPHHHDAAAFRQQVDGHLAAGRIGEALEAVWWWLAATVARDGADPAWTGRELVERSGRRDLVADVRTLDLLLYGPRRPLAGDVERFVRHLDGVLA